MPRHLDVRPEAKLFLPQIPQSTPNFKACRREFLQRGRMLDLISEIEKELPAPVPAIAEVREFVTNAPTWGWGHTFGTDEDSAIEAFDDMLFACAATPEMTPIIAEDFAATYNLSTHFAR